MRAAVLLLATLGSSAGALGCGNGGTGPDDEQPEPTLPATPTVVFSTRLAGAAEGEIAVLRLRVIPAPRSPIALGYAIGVDRDTGTDDADSTDYAGEPRDTVRISAGDTIGIIELAINDDDDIEPAREVLTVTLDAPAQGAGFLLGAPDTAVVLIEEGVCDRTPRIQEEILRVVGFGDCLEPNGEHLAAITDLELCNREEWPLCQRQDAVIPELKQGDFQGLPQLERLTLAGVGLTELPEGVFSDLAGLQTLVLAKNRLILLPERLFAGLSTLGRLSLAGNQLTELPAGVFSGLSSLWRLELSRNPIKELPAGVFSGLSSLSGLAIANSELSDLPAGMFLGLSKLRALDLRANPGTPFGLPLRLVRVDDEDLRAPGPAEITARAEQGTPFPTEVVLFIEGAGSLRDTLDIETGHAQSTSVTVTRDSARTEGTRITMLSVSWAPEDIRGVQFEAADPIVLFARSAVAERHPRSAGHQSGTRALLGSGAGALPWATLSPPARAMMFTASPARAGRKRHWEWRKR